MLRTKHPLYVTWTQMHRRCEVPTATQYADYGGRGISVCERWSDFWAFVADMGERPDGMTLDRFPDNDGNYEPSNCRWATRSQQGLNSRRTIYVEIEGVKYLANDLAKQAGLKPVSIRHRASLGLTLAEVLAPEKITHDFPAHGREKAWEKRRAQTHCKRGHEFTPENTYIANGRRHCRICVNAKGAKWREKKAAEAALLPKVVKERKPRPEQTHCKYGHELTPENTNVYGNRKFCRTCNRERSKAWDAVHRHQ